MIKNRSLQNDLGDKNKQSITNVKLTMCSKMPVDGFWDVGALKKSSRNDDNYPLIHVILTLTNMGYF